MSDHGNASASGGSHQHNHDHEFKRSVIFLHRELIESNKVKKQQSFGP